MMRVQKIFSRRRGVFCYLGLPCFCGNFYRQTRGFVVYLYMEKEEFL